MKNQLTLTVTSRAQTGRSASRRLRKVNRIPAILYGKRTDPEKLSIEGPEFVRLLKSVGGRAVLIELQRRRRSREGPLLPPGDPARSDHRQLSSTWTSTR